MIKVDPQDRWSFERPRSTSLLTMAIIALALIVCGAIYYWYVYLQYSNVYRQLGLSDLPSGLAAEPTVRSRLDQLSHEPCYKDAIISLSNILLDAGYPRDANTILVSFSQRCGDADEVLLQRYRALRLANDHSGAARIADKLVQSYPEDPDIRYSRGATYEELKDFQRALDDYTAAVQLLGKPASIDINNFYDISRMYAATKRYCDAITPLETYISFDPANRRTGQLSKLIAEYAQKGNCATHYASGSAVIFRVPLAGEPGSNTLAVIVNGTPGNFLLDTGATLVSVTADFASRAKLNIEVGDPIPVTTVGGVTIADVGYANTMSVGRAQAQGVTVAVIRGSTDPFGDHLDGLLGMSFLARFKVSLSQDKIELGALPLQ
jgi:clan AA aspartic protease (TIGR02281 family)